MKILVADDEPLILEDLINTIKNAKPEAQVYGFYDMSKLMKFMEENECDVAFLDIEMGAISGIEVAKKLKIMYPKINIIFVTGYNQYMLTAIKMRASGYLLKPATKEDIIIELENLRNPISAEKENILVAKCFGNFDVFVNGKNLNFKRSKTKEMLAYLIDRRGSTVTSGELRAILWKEIDKDENTGVYLQKLKKDLITTLSEAGVRDVFITSWNNYSIKAEKISCDYYDFLDDKPEGIRAYNGEYMSQYSWGEVRNITLMEK